MVEDSVDLSRVARLVDDIGGFLLGNLVVAWPDSTTAEVGPGCEVVAQGENYVTRGFAVKVAANIRIMNLIMIALFALAFSRLAHERGAAWTLC